ncbi:Hypothetical predicted protein, partial [Mytilus galloprovincialis]
RWEIATKSVIFGQDARLTCHSYACSQGSLKKWFGGKRYNLLCLDGTCDPAYPAKYEMVSRESDYQFDLTIKNISLTDTDCSYTCACGFLKYTNMLVFDDFNFTYPLEVLQYSNKTEDNLFETVVSMNVYPLPVCVISFQDITFPTNMSVRNANVVDGMKFYTVDIQHIFDTERYSCKGHLKLSCEVRSIHYTLNTGKLYSCKGYML